MELTNDQKEFIKSQSLEEKPNEACGLILSSDTVIPAINEAHKPQKRFLISPGQLNNILEKHENNQIKAVYHSHLNNPNFTNLDTWLSEGLEVPLILYNIKNNSFNIYTPYKKNLKLEGRPYIPGIIDCFKLVRDYYKRFLNIDIPDLQHPVRSLPVISFKTETLNYYYKHGYDDFAKFFTQNGFKRVNDLQEHDIIIARPKNMDAPVHCLVYLGNNEVLHQPVLKKSRKEALDPGSFNLKQAIVRHKKLT